MGHSPYAPCRRLQWLAMDLHLGNIFNIPFCTYLMVLQEGIFTILVAAIAYLFISNYPSTVSWLSPDERSFIQARLKADSDATNDETFTWAAVLNALKDPKIWLYGACFHTMSLPLYTLSLFLPTIIKDMGYTSAQSQLLTIPPYALATLFTVAWAILAERRKRRALFTLATTSLACIGYIILLANAHPTARPGLSYAGTFLAAMGIYPSVALVLSWPAVNVSGQTKRATANAMQISIGNLGAVMGTQLYRPKWSPRYVVGHSMALAYLIGNLVVVSALWWILKKENERKAVYVREHPETKGFHDSVEDLKMGDAHPRWIFNT
jgi:cyanate permease